MLIWGEILPPPTHPRLGRWPNGLPRPPFGTFPAAGVNLIIFNNTHNKTKLPFSSHTRAHTWMTLWQIGFVSSPKKKRKKLVFNYYYYGYGGAHKVPKCVCLHLARAGQKMWPASSFGFDPSPDKKKEKKIPFPISVRISVLAGWNDPGGGSAGYNLLQSN